MRHFSPLFMLLAVAGCAPMMNPTPTASEADALGAIVQLTRGFDRAGEAYFSPDMQWIVFQATPPGEQHYQMYVAKLKRRMIPSAKAGAAGTVVLEGIHTPVRISPVDSRNTCGYFTPDGNSVIFASTAGKEDPAEPSAGYQRQGRDYRWSYPAGMEIYRADGWQGAVSAAEPGKTVDLAKHRLTDNSAYDAEGSCSPDGRWIVFTSNRSGDLELHAMRPDGSEVVQLTHARGYDGGPFFSPDGKRIIYRSDRKGNDLLQVFIADLRFDASGRITGIGNEKQLTNDGNVNWGPYWHPDGRHIIYATSTHGHQNYELYLMRADGSRKTRITFEPGADVLPVFSPDGRFLLWSSKRGGTTQVFLARFRLPKGA